VSFWVGQRADTQDKGIHKARADAGQRATTGGRPYGEYINENRVLGGGCAEGNAGPVGPVGPVVAAGKHAKKNLFCASQETSPKSGRCISCGITRSVVSG